jgi:hypothetical protein
VDLAPDGRTTPLPTPIGNQDAITTYFDMPNLALNAPTDWRFNWGGEAVQLIDPQGTPWTLYMAGGGPDAAAAPVPVNVARSDAPPDATPTPEGTPAPTEATTVLLQWALLDSSTPLPPGDHAITFSLRDLGGIELGVAPLPTVHVIAPPTVVVAQEVPNAEGTTEPRRVRELPIWDPACDITTGDPVAGTGLEALGISVVPRTERPDASFLLVRRSNSRETFWLPDTDAGLFSNDPTAWQALLAQLPPVTAPTGECGPNNSDAAAPIEEGS